MVQILMLKYVLADNLNLEDEEFSQHLLEDRVDVGRNER
jgi:hypothetical protein